MAVVCSNSYLQAYSEQWIENGQYIASFFSSAGWTPNAIAGILGNIARECTMNPGLWESFQTGNTNVGLGLVQWTPGSKLIERANNLGVDYYSMDGQLQVLLWESQTETEWYKTGSFQITFEEFTHSTQSPDWLAECFMRCYERPGVLALDERKQYALWWMENMEPGTVFVPREDDSGIRGNPYYYSDNPFYQSGYGMPNCTCYAWGRAWELTGERPTLPTSNGGEWWIDVGSEYEKGQEPRLGAIACWYDPSGVGSGHVAVVEAISTNPSTIATSNSAWQGTFWWMETCTFRNGGYYSDWMIRRGYKFQGFIYLPLQYGMPVPPQPPYFQEKSVPFWFYQIINDIIMTDDDERVRRGY